MAKSVLWNTKTNTLSTRDDVTTQDSGREKLSGRTQRSMHGDGTGRDQVPESAQKVLRVVSSVDRAQGF